MIAAPKVIHEKTGSVLMFYNNFTNQSMLGIPWNSSLCNSSSWSLSLILAFNFSRFMQLCPPCQYVRTSTSSCWNFHDNHSFLWWRCKGSRWRWSRELVDKPGSTTRSKFFCIAQNCPILGQIWLLTTGQMVSIPKIFAEPPVYFQGASLLRINPLLGQIPLSLLLLVLRRWLSPPSADFFEKLTVSSSAVKVFLADYVHACLKSTTKSLSSEFTVDAASKIHSS